MRIILASGSPRRRAMLRDLGVRFEVRVPSVDESPGRGERPLEYAARLARAKAEAAARALGATPRYDWAILAADTIVVLGGRILGKPRSEADARRMLGLLSGRTHEVITAFQVLGSRDGHPRRVSGHARTRVSFSAMPASFWAWYVSTDEPMDKAGAYAAQGIGLSFIDRVEGSYSNVVGLPLSRVLAAFRRAFSGDLRVLGRKPRRLATKAGEK